MGRGRHTSVYNGQVSVEDMSVTIVRTCKQTVVFLCNDSVKDMFLQRTCLSLWSVEGLWS
jgi:hypothetical protein